MKLSRPSIVLGILLTLTYCDALANGHAVVFMYHHFGEDRHPSTNIPIDKFEQHLKFLKENRFSVVALQDIVNALQTGRPLPHNAVAITMDDAYRSVYQHAFPRLKTLGWPFTVFVNTDAIDQRLPKYLSWQQIREMHAFGATFANHSATHDYLIRLRKDETVQQWRTRVRRDIQRAQQRLTEELGSAPSLFAYPYGEYNEALAALVSELGLVGFGQHSGAIGPNSDLRALPRFPINTRYAALNNFAIKARSYAMPVLNVTPWNPVTHDTRPTMRVTVDGKKLVAQQIACFVSGQGQVGVKWLEEPLDTFEIRALDPLPAGRSRYNCTAPVPNAKRFYWFSHLWIREHSN